MSRARGRTLPAWAGLAFVGAAATALASAAAPPAQSSPRADAPRLVVVLAIDQLRPDRLTAELPGGLGRLEREGRVFEDAALEFANTDTCPGYAAMLTGLEPGSLGVPGDEYVDRATGRVRSCVEDDASDAQVFGEPDGAPGRSPRAIAGTTLGDWMKASWLPARVFAISANDRAAIPLGGRHPDAAYWLDRREPIGFTTSRYYREALPDWLLRFDGSDPPHDGFWATLPETWTHPTGAPANGARRDDDPAESPRFHRTSPHPLRTDDARTTLKHLDASPYVDLVTLDLAKRLIEEDQLGDDRTPDLLAISFSAMGTIGRLYGPESQEARDALHRLDAAMAKFLRFLERRTHGRVLVVLTADHGVLPIPEWLEKTGRSACPVAGGRVDAGVLARELGADLAQTFGAPSPEAGPWLIRTGLRLTVNRPLATSLGVDPDAVVREAEAFLSREPGIARVWTAQKIASGQGPEPFATLYRHSYAPKRSADLVIQPRRDCLITSSSYGTSAGTPYVYDRAVPLVFWGDGVDPGVVRGRAAPIDIAPTLAAVLGLKPPTPLDGHALPLRNEASPASASSGGD